MKNERVDEGKRSQLLGDGYCVMENILDHGMLHRLALATNTLLQRQTREEAERDRSTGSMISVDGDPLFASLIAWPNALRALARLGFDNPKFTNGYIISKPPSSPPLFWHHDYVIWDDPDAFGPVPQQLFLMYYLVDTSPENGCLRVIPRSHLQDNPLHALLEEAHSNRLREAVDLFDPAFSNRPDEVDVMVSAGDLVIGDSRLLHAAHANNSNRRRTVITLWYHPDLEALHESVQALIAKMAMVAPDHWPQEARAMYEPLRARYDGKVAPIGWSRRRPPRTPYG